MKPAILTDPDDCRLAWLVDEHSAAVWFERKTGKHLRHFETAVLIQDLRPGEFRFRPEVMLGGPMTLGLEDEPKRIAPEITACMENGMFAPWPAVYATINPHSQGEFKRAYADTDGPEVCNGIHKRAAEVLLRLAASWNDVQPDRVTETLSFSGKVRIEKVPVPWDTWAFLTAWLWSDWEARSRRKKITLAARFEEMQAAGYPNGIKAFEGMHLRLFPKPTH
jgi:hypothetical protein